MKRLLVISGLLLGMLFSGFAQKTNPKPGSATESQKKLAKEKKKAKKEALKKEKKAQKQVVHATKKDGTRDMRFKENKKKEVAVKIKPRPIPPPVARKQNPVFIPKQTPPPAARTADRIIGTDEKGRTIYEGPRGGRYYINKNGNKEYIKHT